MLYPYRVIAQKRFSAASGEKLCPEAGFLEIQCILDQLFDETPELLRQPGGRSLMLLYRDAAYTWDDICNCVGRPAAAVSGGCSLRFFGTAGTRETVEMTVFAADDAPQSACWMRLRSLSGTPAEQMRGLGLQIDLPNPRAADCLALLAAQLSRNPSCGAVPRHLEPFLRDCGILARSEGSLFAYYAWAQPSPAQLLSSLTAAHKAQLWRRFLEDDVQPLEFAWLWSAYYTEEAAYLLEWEMTLRMVLDELGYQIERGDASFRLLDAAGTEKRFDFAKGGPAEKLLLKCFFPLDAK